MAGKGRTPRTKRQTVKRDCESINSPSLNQNRSNKPSIVIISSSNQDTGNKKRPIHEGFDESSPNDTVDTVKDIDDITILKSKMDKVITAVGLLSKAWIDQSNVSLAFQTPTTNVSNVTDRMMAAENILHSFIQPNQISPKETKEYNIERAKGLVKKLFTPPDTNFTLDMIIASHTKTPLGSPSNKEPNWVPSWLTNIFGSNIILKLTNEEIAVATYIFKTPDMNQADWKEVLVKSCCRSSYADRKMMSSLKPKGLVEQEILNLLSCMLTLNERLSNTYPCHWFLPTTFAQYAISWSSHPNDMIRFYHNSHMGKVDMLSKIFIPVNDDNLHWYLIVLDFDKNELVYLDSCPQPDRMATRMLDTKILAVYIEKMFSNKIFYEYEFTKRPIISEFNIIIPKGLGIQKNDSNDCGIWVAKWMKEMGKNDYKIEVDNISRMRIAIDLAMDPSNSDQEELITKSMTYYQECKEAATVIKRT